MDISDRFDIPIVVELLAKVSNVASELGVPFFIVGATARNLVLQYGCGIRIRRATRDIDIGVRVASHDQFESLKSALTATGDFTQEAARQRMLFRKTVQVDLIPFGAILDVEKNVVWPDGEGKELSLIGFEEAYRNALKVKVSSDPLVEVMVASATGQVLMKILAWDERRPGTKDAIDLGVLIRTYLDVGNDLRLYEKHQDLMDTEDFDYQVAGAHLLGRDLARICEPETRQRVLSILQRELKDDGDLPLVVQSADSSPQIGRTLEFWRAIRQELAEAG